MTPVRDFLTGFWIVARKFLTNLRNGQEAAVMATTYGSAMVISTLFVFFWLPLGDGTLSFFTIATIPVRVIFSLIFGPMVGIAVVYIIAIVILLTSAMWNSVVRVRELGRQYHRARKQNKEK